MRRIVMACVICATATFARAQPAPEEVEVPAQPDDYADTDPSALSDFRAPLAPYGSWVDDPTYGTVWIPHRAIVGAAFVPYQTAGHWALDGNDYVWVSDYPWGWLPFHYGRWVFIDGTGWAWIPGREYAPAWVDWSVADDYDYVGWYPTPPDFIWWGGIAVGLAVVPSVDFFFCPTPFLFDDHVHRHVVHGELARNLQRHSHALGTVAVASHGVFARGYGRGPDLRRLGDIRVARTSPNERQVMHARRYATPATARAAGASPPSAHRVKVPATRTREAAPRAVAPREIAPTTPRTTAPGVRPPGTTAPGTRPPGTTAPGTATPHGATPRMPVPNETIPGVPEPSTPLPEKAPTTPNHAAPPTHSAPPVHAEPPPVHSAPPIHSAPPPSPPHHRAPSSEAPAPSAPAPTPPKSPSTPVPSSSDPGAFDSAAGIAGL
jgi:hypothetical protein